MEQEQAPPIHVAMSRVMADMKAIEKKNRNQQQGYAFRGIDDVFNELQPVLVDHGVWYTPEEIISNEHEWRQTQKGGWQHSTVLRIRYRFYGPAGDSVAMESIGESADPADKSTQQAMSQALKSGLLQTFCIRTHESAKNDPDAKSPKAGPPAQSQEPKPPSATGGQAKRDSAEPKPTSTAGESMQSFMLRELKGPQRPAFLSWMNENLPDVTITCVPFAMQKSVEDAINKFACGEVPASLGEPF